MSRYSTREIHKLWLAVTAITVGSFGPIFALGTMESTAELARLSIDILDWPPDGAQTFASADTRFLSALTGGFLLGWGVMIWCLRIWVYDLAPEPVRRCVLVGLLAWFCLDSLGSIGAGAISNVYFNVAVLLICIGPLWQPARD